MTLALASSKATLSYHALRANFPKQFDEPWDNQDRILRHAAENGSSIYESPTGTGKTATEVAILRAAEKHTEEPLFFIVPTKALVDQIKREYPDLKVAYGRSEHPCLYYEPKKGLKQRLTQLTIGGEGVVKADDVPCSLLSECPHRVDQETGETYEEGAIPCPYLQQKYEAKQGGIVLCTMSFFLFTHLFSQEFETPDVLVIDEAHKIAEVFRNALSYDITDHHIERSVELLKKIGAEQADGLQKFLRCMKKIIKRKPSHEATLLNDEEIEELIDVLLEVDQNALARNVKAAVKEKRIDVVEDRVTLRKLETLIRDIRRYIHTFEFSLPGEGPRGKPRGPLNYTCAFYKEEKGENDKVQYKLVIRCYYVAPLIKKVLSPQTFSFSATIGDPEIFGYETGIKGAFLSLDSTFSIENTRIYMPTDTPNLAVNYSNKRDKTQSIRKIVRAAARFKKKGIRCLVVTVSNDERDKVVMLAEEEKLFAVSYGNGVTARAAALMFKNGEGDILVGTSANYAEGIDLPKQIAPVIFVLRPGYPNPKDPGTIFEERRFGGRRWQLWNWRVMLTALQVRGRNVRGPEDVGVTFFVSQQFRRFVHASLPHWLEKAYRGEQTWEQCITDAEKLLG